MDDPNLIPNSSGGAVDEENMTSISPSKRTVVLGVVNTSGMKSVNLNRKRRWDQPPEESSDMPCIKKVHLSDSLVDEESPSCEPFKDTSQSRLVGHNSDLLEQYDSAACNESRDELVPHQSMPLDHSPSQLCDRLSPCVDTGISETSLFSEQSMSESANTKVSVSMHSESVCDKNINSCSPESRVDVSAKPMKSDIPDSNKQKNSGNTSNSFTVISHQSDELRRIMCSYDESSTDSESSNGNIVSASINRVAGIDSDVREGCQNSLTVHNSLNEISDVPNVLNEQGAKNSLNVIDRFSCPTDKGHENILDELDEFHAKLEAKEKAELESHSNIPNLQEPVKSSTDGNSCKDLPDSGQCMMVTYGPSTEKANSEFHNTDFTPDPLLKADFETEFQANETESVVVQKENNILSDPHISNDSRTSSPEDNSICAAEASTPEDNSICAAEASAPEDNSTSLKQSITPIVEASSSDNLGSTSHANELLENNIDACVDTSNFDEVECEETLNNEPCFDTTPAIEKSETITSEQFKETDILNNSSSTGNVGTTNELSVTNQSYSSNQTNIPDESNTTSDNKPTNANSCDENSVSKLSSENITENQCSIDQSDIGEPLNREPDIESNESNAVEMNLTDKSSNLIEVKDSVDSSDKMFQSLEVDESLENSQEIHSAPLPTCLSGVDQESSQEKNCAPNVNLALNNNILNAEAKEGISSPTVFKETTLDNSPQPLVDDRPDNLDETGERSSVSCDEQLSNDNISRSSYPEIEDTQSSSDQVPNNNVIGSNQKISNEEKSFKLNYPTVENTQVDVLSSNNIDPLVMQVIFGSSGDKSQAKDDGDDDSRSMQSAFDSDSNTGSNINLSVSADDNIKNTSSSFNSLIEDIPRNEGFKTEIIPNNSDIEGCQNAKTPVINEKETNDVSGESDSLPEEKYQISKSSDSKLDFSENVKEIIHEKNDPVDMGPSSPTDTSPNIESVTPEIMSESPKSEENCKEPVETSCNIKLSPKNSLDIMESETSTLDQEGEYENAIIEPQNKGIDTTEDLSGDISSNSPIDSQINELTRHDSDSDSHEIETLQIKSTQENQTAEEKIVKSPATVDSSQIPGSPSNLSLETSETKNIDVFPDDLKSEGTIESVENTSSVHNCLPSDIGEMIDEHEEVKEEDSASIVSNSENIIEQDAVSNESKTEVCKVNNAAGKEASEIVSHIPESIEEKVSCEPVVEGEEASVRVAIDSEEVPEVSEESTLISRESEVVQDASTTSEPNSNQDSNIISKADLLCVSPRKLDHRALPNDFEEPMDIAESVTLTSEKAEVEPSVAAMDEDDVMGNNNSSVKIDLSGDKKSKVSVDPLVNNTSENVEKEITEEIESYDVVEEVVTCESPGSEKNIENELEEVVDDDDADNDDYDNDEVTVRSPPSLVSEETLETVHESIGNSDHIEAVIENDTSDLRESDIDNQNEVFIESEVAVDVGSFSTGILKRRDDNFEKRDSLLNSLRDEFPSRKRDSSAVNSITSPNVSPKREIDIEDSSDSLPPVSKKRRIEYSSISSTNAVISDSKVLKDLVHSDIPLLKTTSSPILQKNENILNSELCPNTIDKQSHGSKLEPITLRIYKDNLSVKTDDLDSPKRNKSPKFSSEILNQQANSPTQKGPLSPQTKQLEFTLKIAKDMNTNKTKATMSPKSSMSPSNSWKLDSGSLSPSSPGESGILKLKLTKPCSPSFSKDSSPIDKSNDLIVSQSTELPKASLEIGSALKKMIESEKSETKTEGSILQQALISDSPLTNSVVKKRGRPRKIILPTTDAEGNPLNHSPITPLDSPSLDTSGDSEQSNRQVRSCRSRTLPIVVKTRRPRGGGGGRGGGRGGAKGVARPITSEKEAEKIQEKLSEYEKAELAKIEARKEKMRLDRIARNEAKKAKKLAKKLKDEERRKRVAAEKAEKAAAAAPQVFEEETRMSAPGSRGHTPAPSSLLARLNQASDNPEESQSSISTSNLNKKGRMEIPIDPESDEVRVEHLAEYQWQGSELCMIQEQVSLYLGVKSFKRKYPDLKRRVVEAEERTFLEDSGLVPKSMCDLGLTAVSSAEVLDIMFHDFHEKYEEFRGYMREKESKEYSFKQKALSAKVTDKSKGEPRELALEAVAMWNLNLNRERKEDRRCALDLQTFTVHYPKSAREKMQRPGLRPGLYPVPVIPGQFSDYYKTYTPTELMYFPLNTVMYGPLKPNERRPDHSDGSDSSSSSSDDSSNSSCGSESEDEDNSSKECKICNGEKKSTSEAHPEILLQCSQCKGLCHPTCQEITPEMLPHIKKYSWHCSNCKTCVRCNNSAKEEKKLFCDLCDRGYHLSCVGLKTSPEGRWHCSVCSFCTICGSKDPGGPEWHYEYKKTDKGVRLYQRTLCVPCSKTALL